jgi:hypothetical protein
LVGTWDEGYKLLLSLYDQGLRADDVIIMITTPSIVDMLSLCNSQEERDKVTEFEQALIFIPPGLVVGSEGERIASLLAVVSEYGSVEIGCIAYNGMKLVLLAADFVVKRGGSFKDIPEVMKALRAVKFVGCSGVTNINYTDNDRRHMLCSARQNRFNGESYDTVVNLQIDIEGTQLYTQYSYFIWLGGGSEVPKTYRLNYEVCPYPLEWKHNSREGRQLSFLIGLGVGIALLSALGAYFLLHRKAKIQLFKHPFVMSTQDNLFLVSTAAEVLLLQLFSPGHQLAKAAVSVLVRSFFVDNEDYYEGGYFKLLNAVIAVLSVWLVCAVYVLSCRTNQWPKWMVILCSSAANGLITFCCLLVFDCTVSYSKDDDKTVMDLDCFEECWEADHLAYAIAVVVLLAVFFSVSQMALPLAVNDVEGSHLDQSPVLVQAKFLLVVVTVFLYKHKSYIGEVPYQALTFLGSALFSTAIVKFSYFNVPLINAKFRAGMLALLVYQVCETLYLSYEETWVKIFSVSLLAAALLLILLVYKLAARKLATTKDSNSVRVAKWLAFAFRRNSIVPIRED